MRLIGLAIQGYIIIFKALWSKYGTDIMEILKNAFNMIAIMFNNFLNLIKNVLKILNAIFKGDLNGIFEGVKSLFVDSFLGIFNLIKVY